MKMKMTLVAGALALAMAGQASAAILGGSGSGNGDLVLSIWDATTQVSYTADLGITLDQFMGTGAPVVNVGASFVAGNAGNNGLSQTFTADATLTSFLAGVAATDTTSWNVVAMDGTGAGLNGYRFLTTTTASAIATNNAAVKTYNSTPDVFMTAVSLAAGTGTSVSVAQSANASAYAGSTTFGNNFGGKANFSNTTAIGQSQNFFFLTPSSASGIAAASVGQFGNATGVSTWTLASNGNLTYAVAAVPEPGEWLLMLSGLCLIGFIATRRKNAGSMTFA
jgi:hypothetical protein